MLRVLYFGLGIFFSSIGLMFCILYLNLLTLGYSFLNLVYFIIRRGECLLLLLGILFIIGSLEGRKIYELLLRRRSKF